MTAIAPEMISSDLDDDIVHFVCDVCYPPPPTEDARAMCGVEVDIDREEVISPDPGRCCVVCEEMVERPCERCGTVWAS